MRGPGKHDPAIHVGQCMTMADVVPCADCDVELPPKYKKLAVKASELQREVDRLRAEQSRLFAEAHQRRYGAR